QSASPGQVSRRDAGATSQIDIVGISQFSAAILNADNIDLASGASITAGDLTGTGTLTIAPGRSLNLENTTIELPVRVNGFLTVRSNVRFNAPVSTATDSDIVIDGSQLSSNVFTFASDLTVSGYMVFFVEAIQGH